MSQEKYVVQVGKNGNLWQSLDESFKAQFYKLGQTVGKYPWYFIIVPTLICLTLTIGLVRFQYVNDPEYLMAPIEGPGKEERKIFENYFKFNYSAFNPSRIPGTVHFVSILVEAQSGGNILQQDTWTEMLKLDTIIKNVSVVLDGQKYQFESLCAKWQDRCFENEFLEIASMIQESDTGNLSLPYPIMFNPETYNSYILPTIFGGMKVSNGSTLEQAKSVRMLYFLYSETLIDNFRAHEWEGAVLDILDNLQDEWEFINVQRLAFRSIPQAMDETVFVALPMLAFTVPLMIIFGAFTMMSTEVVRAKPWLGIASVLTTQVGCMGGLGVICLILGHPFTAINMTGLFLTLGIGMDDSFVMLAAWRRTCVKDSVPKRLAEAYSEAAVSITITSLTDMFSFWVGVGNPFHSVRIFCLYTGATVAGTYLCHVTIFGAAMALSGYHEAEGRHGLFFWKPALKTGDIDKTVESNPHVEPSETSDYRLMAFFRDHWARYLNKPFVKFLVILLFIIYLTISGYGISRVEEGVDLSHLAIYGSPAQKYFNAENIYFRHFAYRIQVIITGDVDYSNKTTQIKIERMLQQFEQSKFVGSEGAILTESWLRSFLRYAERLKSADMELNMTSEQSFIQSLEENYLGPSTIFSEDVKFNQDKTKIIASRFIIQTVNISNSIVETEMIKTLRAIVEEQSSHLNVTLYNPYFVFFDQYLIIRSTTIKSVVVTGLIMMVLSLIFIPNPLCSVWVGLSIISIEAGLMGFLVLWNVNMDVVSSICLIMCIGFSVDFSVHISYSYISSKATTTEEKVKECLYSVGMPIVQGASSTVLGICSLAWGPSYVLTTFFKALTLVMVIATAHGLLLLPVLLSLFGPTAKNVEEPTEKYARKKSIS